MYKSFLKQQGNLLTYLPWLLGKCSKTQRLRLCAITEFIILMEIELLAEHLTKSVWNDRDIC